MIRGNPARLTALEAVSAIRTGRLEVRDLVEACLARVEDRDAEVRAWAALDLEAVRITANRTNARDHSGPLHGLPIGVKDVFATAELPTGCGSPIYRGRHHVQDAACVSAARQAGALILGKTHTTEFAAFSPTLTRNPLNLLHTPGGSSSGSAAAVADCMVPLAFGTQTAGSIIRPASFCGIVGYKPTFDLIERTGLKPFANSLDTVGVFARTVADAALFAGCVADWPALAAPPEALPPQRLRIFRGPGWDRISTQMAQAVDDAATACSRAGIRVEEFRVPADFGRVVAAQELVQLFEGRRALAYERERFADQLSLSLRAVLDRASEIAFEDYLAARKAQQDWTARFESLMAPGDVCLTASALGEAPEGLEHTGDPMLSRAWTFLLVPCLSIPYGSGAKGLPLGVQLIGRHGQDIDLLAAARFVEQVLA